MIFKSIIRPIILGILFVISCSSITSCHVKEKVHLSRTKFIPLPDSLILFEDHSFSLVPLGLDSTTVIVLVDSNDCQLCHVSNIEALRPLYERSKADSSFRLYIVFSPPSISVKRFMKQVVAIKPKIPFYIDTTYTLMQEMASDHIFVLNKNGELVK